MTQLDREAGRTRGSYNVASCTDRVQFERTTNDRLHWTDMWEEVHFF